MASEIIINDTRDNFKLATFSNHKKKDVCKQLQNAIYYNKAEETLYWTGEILCTNMLLELWETFFVLMSKYIHIHNPRLPLYIKKKYQEFRELANSIEDADNIRNDHRIRVIFFSIATVLRDSPKLTILDDLKCKFDFKIETLYDNLKAPNVEYAGLVIIDDDPKEYLIPINEFIYHLTTTKRKADVVYWLNWIIEYDILCRKKKKELLIVRRDFFESSRKILERNVIWLVWEVILKISQQKLSKDLQNIILSIFELFAARYVLTTNKKRICMLFHCIEIILLNDDIKTTRPIVTDNKIFDNLEANINVIFEQIKGNEVVAVKEDPGQSESKMDIYKSIYMNL